MKNKKIKGLITLILFLTIALLSSTVESTTSKTILADWDSTAAGVDDGKENFIEWNNTGEPNFFETSTDVPVTAPNSLKLHQDAPPPATNASGYLNLTSDFNYISVINFSYYIPAAGGGDDIYMNFYDGNDPVIRLRWSGLEVLSWFDVSSGYTVIYDSDPDIHYYVVITHNNTNRFNISVYNATFVFKAGRDIAGSYAGDYTTFNQIKLYITGVGTQNIYFDNFYIESDTEGYSTIGYCELPETLIFSSGEFGQEPFTHIGITNRYLEFATPNHFTGNNIQGVYLLCMPTQSLISTDVDDYKCYVNGIPLGSATNYLETTDYDIIYWCGVDIDISKAASHFLWEDGRVILEFSSAKKIGNNYWHLHISPGHPGENPFAPGITADNGRFLTHDVFTYYGNGYMQGSAITSSLYPNSECFYYLGFYYLPIPNYQKEQNTSDSDRDWLIDTGNPDFNYSNIQFRYWDSDLYECHYRQGSNPEIMYYLTNEYMSGNCNTYLAQIVNTVTGDIVYTFPIYFNTDNESKYKVLSNFFFTTAGQYRILLYNTTDNCSGLGDYLFPSREITVCGKTVPGSQEWGVIDFSNIPSLYKLIVAVFIIILLTITPYAFSVVLGKGNIEVQLPSLIYVAFFIFGIVLSVSLGLLDAWVIAVVLIGLILTIIVLWLQTNDGS